MGGEYANYLCFFLKKTTLSLSHFDRHQPSPRSIKGPSRKKPCGRGSPVECGQEIRLEHQTTSRNLHSHHFSSPLSSSQEVSAFGEDGEGDTGDVWTVVCDGDTDFWQRDQVRREIGTGGFDFF